MTGYGLETDNPDLVIEGRERSVEALREAAKSGMERLFAELFPGEDIPEDHWELRRRVDKKILTSKEFEEIYGNNPENL